MKQHIDQPLTVKVENGELVIRIGVNTLASAIATGDRFHKFDVDKHEYLRDFAIVDEVQFAHDVGIEMEKLEEDGSSPLSKLIEETAQAAIESGSTGTCDQLIAYGQKSKVESW